MTISKQIPAAKVAATIVRRRGRRTALGTIKSPISIVPALVYPDCAYALQPAATPESVGFSSERLMSIAGTLQDGVAKHDIPGAVVLLARRGKIAYFQSFGDREPRSDSPMTNDVIFRIASMTKPITTTAAMMLVDEGRLDLSDPVSRHLPAFKNLMVGVEKKDAAGHSRLVLEPAVREMTVLDLMRHTAGLTYGFFGKSPVKDLYNAANVLDRNQTNADVTAKLARLPLRSQPGTLWEYSMSTDVLGRIVEVLSGMELGHFFEERIFKPLGMTDSGYWLSDAAKQSRIAATPIDPASGKPAAWGDKTVKSWQGGGGGIVSTASDYANFCQMLLNRGEFDGVRILSAKSVETMTSDQLPQGIAINSTTLAASEVRPEAGYGFGLGFMVRTTESHDGVRGSLGDFSWNGALGTYFWVDPKRALFGIILIQTPASVWARTTEYWVRVRNLVYEALTD